MERRAEAPMRIQSSRAHAFIGAPNEAVLDWFSLSTDVQLHAAPVRQGVGDPTGPPLVTRCRRSARHDRSPPLGAPAPARRTRRRGRDLSDGQALACAVCGVVQRPERTVGDHHVGRQITRPGSFRANRFDISILAFFAMQCCFCHGGRSSARAYKRWAYCWRTQQPSVCR